ncbi:MAG: sugar kinase, ribokinase [Anaerocolumna sp.]|jgi:sugar/nucleoside kinase (ribokinase family)|nr:sugar kinase, ribokinase [Anaerocolumna sp.]
MEEKTIYMYGMILVTNSFLLSNNFPKAEGYGDIHKRYILTGGETGTAAIVLANLGCKLILDGTHLGTITEPINRECFHKLNVDISRLTYDNTYDGCLDYVFIDKDTRTIFGSFGEYFNKKHWNTPSIKDIEAANVVALDPFFMDETMLVVRYCRETGTKYATIDCEYDSDINRYCEINAISHSFLDDHYPNLSYEELHHKYTENTDGLVIFTMGSKPIMYGRKGEPIKYYKTYPITPISTLGAGDCFKAGTIYALNEGMNDYEIVSFASATSAVACLGYPIEYNPPTLEKIRKMQEKE